MWVRTYSFSFRRWSAWTSELKKLTSYAAETGVGGRGRRWALLVATTSGSGGGNSVCVAGGEGDGHRCMELELCVLMGD